MYDLATIQRMNALAVAEAKPSNPKHGGSESYNKPSSRVGSLDEWELELLGFVEDCYGCYRERGKHEAY